MATSDEILAQYMAQTQAQNKWNSPQNLINMATLGLGGISGLAAGAASGRAQEQSTMDQQMRLAQEAYMRRLQARQGLQGAIMGQLDSRQQGARDMAAQSPLGAEQMYAMEMARARGLSNMAEQFRPISPGPQSTIGGFVPQNPNILGAFTSNDFRNTISPGATERAITDRRNVLAGLDPDMKFGSTSAYGLSGSLDGEADGYRRGRAADRLTRENQLMQLLNAQMEEASKPLYQEPGTGASAPKEQKKGFWSKLGSAILPIAGVAANFIPGVGPLAGLALSAAGGAAGGALGGGVKGAVLGGMGGAAAGYGINRGSFGNKTPGAGFETNTDFLGPMALGQGAPQLPELQNSMQLPWTQMPGATAAVRPQAPQAAPVSRPQMSNPAFGGGDTRGAGASGRWVMNGAPPIAPMTPATSHQRPAPFVDPKVGGIPGAPGAGMRHPQAGPSGGGFNPMAILGGGSPNMFSGAKVGGMPNTQSAGVMSPQANPASGSSPLIVGPNGEGVMRIPYQELHNWLAKGWTLWQPQSQQAQAPKPQPVAPPKWLLPG